MLETIISEVPTLNLVEVNKNISEGLARVEEVKHKIELFKEESNSIKIADENDKAGYAATKEFLSKVRPTRTNLENERKAVVKPFNDLIGNVNDAYKNATSQLAAIEAPHKQDKEDYEAAEETRKAEAVAAKEKVINDKIALLLQNGLEYNSASHYYRNDSGRAITRMDITNMPVEDFERFLEMVKSDYEVAQDKIREELKLQETIKKRFNELILLTVPQNVSSFLITDADTEELTQLSFDDLKILDETSFDSIKDKMVSVLNKNIAYYKKIKDNAVAVKAKADQDEKDLLERENKITEKELELKKSQIKLIHSKLPAFTFEVATPIENSLFIYKNYDKVITISVSHIFSNDGAIDDVNSQMQELIKEGEKAAAKKIENDNIESANQLKLKQDKEAKRKVLSRKEIAIIDPCVAEIFNQIAFLRKQKLELVNVYAITFIQSVEAAIERYNNDLRHLR